MFLYLILKPVYYSSLSLGLEVFINLLCYFYVYTFKYCIKLKRKPHPNLCSFSLLLKWFTNASSVNEFVFTVYEILVTTHFSHSTPVCIIWISLWYKLCNYFLLPKLWYQLTNFSSTSVFQEDWAISSLSFWKWKVWKY